MTLTKRLFFLVILFSIGFGVSFRHYAPKVVRKIVVIQKENMELIPGVPIKFLKTSEEAKKLLKAEDYWGEHTVNDIPHATAEASLEYLDWRSRQ